jgi:hypothetical protein
VVVGPPGDVAAAEAERDALDELLDALGQEESER